MASFCIEQKEELIRQLPKSGCCRRSLLHGVLAVRGEIILGGICVKLENGEIADAVSLLVKEFFGKECEVLPKARGERSVTIGFSSPSAMRYLGEIEKTDSMAPIPKCACCTAYFLQGIFLACGRLSSPQKQYCLEFLPKNRENALYDYLLDLGIEMKRATRNGERVLYLKNSCAMEDFFVNALMNATAFRIMNAKIEGEFRSNAARYSNCELKNLSRTLDARDKHVRAILRLEEQGLLSSLPDELENTARLRLAHPNLSLTLLAGLCVPPVTKPGLSHRLNKIVAIAARLAPPKEEEKQ